jgi:hypothetical protein
MVRYLWLVILLSVLPVDAAKWRYVPSSPTDVFVATGSGGNAGFCAEAEDSQYLSGHWLEVADASLISGAVLQSQGDYLGQASVVLDFTSGTYYGWAVGRCTKGDRCAVWVQYGTPFAYTPSNTTASKFPLGGALAVLPIGTRADEDLERPLTASDVTQRAFSITQGQPLYVMAQDGVQLDYLFFATSANAIPSCTGAPVETVNLVIYHTASLPTPDGTLDTIWTNAPRVVYGGLGSATAAWDTRALYNKTASPRRLCLVHRGTLANAEFPTTTEDASGVFTSDTALRLDFREDQAPTRPLSYSTATNGNATPTTRDGQFNDADAFGSSLDFANRASGRSYAANLLHLEHCFDLPSALVEGSVFRCDFRALEKVIGQAQTSKYAYAPDGTLATAGLCQLSSATVPAPPADATAPSVGAISFSNVTSSTLTASATASDAESGISACQVQWDTDNDNAVSGGDASALTPCGLPQAGSCVCPISNLTPGTAYEVAITATNGVGLTASSAVADQTTGATGAQRYLSPTGTDTGDCSNAGAPCRTFAYALASARFPAGATLNLANGEYGSATSTGYPNINCASGSTNGTAALISTIQATNARQAWIKGTGAQTQVNLENCSYWRLTGLRISSADLNNPNGGSNVTIRNATNIRFDRNLVHTNNRYLNVNLLMVRNGSSAVLIEQNEFYDFHRKAIQMYQAANNTVRGNYFNALGVGNLSGGHQSQGSECVSNYPASNNLIESNICEVTTGSFPGFGFTVDASAAADNNRFFGNIARNLSIGSFVVTRGTTASLMPKNTYTKDFVAAGVTTYGLDLRSTRNSASAPSCEQCSIFPTATATAGMTARQAGSVGDGQYEFVAVNSLVRGVGAGVGVRLLDQDVISAQSMGVSAVATAFEPPASDPGITGEVTSDPQVGACVTYVPNASPYKGAGVGGADIGANAMFRYVDGVKTTLPMFLSGSDYVFYACGAEISGINSDASRSCKGVHQRLNLHAAASPRCTPPY